MVKLIGSFSQIKSAKVLVVGDFMLDTYTTGRVDRISPEAPVPVLHVQESEDLPGGAGNVVLNLEALGAKVIALGRIGHDKEGLKLKSLLKEHGTDTRGLFVQEHFDTPIKNRLMANAQQLIRIDREQMCPVDPKVEKQVIDFIKESIEEVEVIAISDYQKGFLSRKVLKTLIDLGNEKGIPTIIDPKGEDFTKYQAATLIKPNLKEAYLASKLTKEASLKDVGHSLLQLTSSDAIMITRSEQGISLFSSEQDQHDFPIKSREVKDVTGAGDTVLAMTTMTFASDLDIKEGLHLANVAAGIAIERVGCVRVSLSDIAERLLESDAKNKVFDEEHLFALEQALCGKKLTILGINTQDGVSSSLFGHIQALSSKKRDQKLMIYLIDTKPDIHFIELLSSLHEVDFITLQSDSLTNLCQKIHPENVYTLENNQLVTMNHANELLITTP